jgi:hypothetical protein
MMILVKARPGLHGDIDDLARHTDRTASAPSSPSTRRIFVSSTYVDLKAHRALLRQNLERMRQFPVVMESFGAGGTDATTVSKAEVGASDLVVLLVAWRYGVVPEQATRSITHQEYELARSLGKPIFVFLADPATEAGDGPTALFPAKTRNSDFSAQLRDFRTELINTERHTYDFFTTPEDLSAKAVTALARHILLTGEGGGGSTGPAPFPGNAPP